MHAVAPAPPRTNAQHWIDLLEDAAIKNQYLREAIDDSKRRLYEAA
jgi:predicted DNA-binding protein (MmcQ/YjbR family)